MFIMLSPEVYWFRLATAVVRAGCLKLHSEPGSALVSLSKQPNEIQKLKESDGASVNLNAGTK
jgi:hypothetical protein